MCHVIPTVHTMACVMSSLLYTLWHVSCHPYCTQYDVILTACTQYGMCHVIHSVYSHTLWDTLQHIIIKHYFHSFTDAVSNFQSTC